MRFCDISRFEGQTRDYYRARANEFEEWYLRRGAYSHGPESDATWTRELNQMEECIGRIRDRTVLEVASGTGWWTRHLSSRNRVVATDYAPEMITRARQLADPAVPVDRCRADAYRLPVAAGIADVCFFGFWLSHVPVSRAPEFVREARRIVRPGGEIWLLDSRQASTSGKNSQKVAGQKVQQQRRTLNDGRDFEIWKIYWSLSDLRYLLGLVCDDVELTTTPTYFVMARGRVSEESTY